MKKKKLAKCLFFISFFVLSGFYLSSCDDESPYTKNEPDFLEDSVYDYLEKEGYTYFLRMVDKVRYDDVLKRTGSNTVFAVKDEAFEEFFRNNDLGIHSFDDFTESQLRNILFSSMLKDAYLLSILSNITGNPPTGGQTMRRPTLLNVLDTIPYETPDMFPATKYWAAHSEKSGIYLLKDNTERPMVYFLKPQMKAQGITDEDFQIISNFAYEDDGYGYLFDNKIIEKDITCKNGYIHVLEKLQIPPGNLAEYIASNNETSLFNSFLNRYNAPFYDEGSTSDYRESNPEFSDSIFVKRYFNNQTGGSAALTEDPDENNVDGVLAFDPGRNSFRTSPGESTSLLTDMAAMFVPTNEALDYYFNQGAGTALKDRYGTWENIPNNVLNILINNHMKVSFLASLPSLFHKLEDKMGTLMNVAKEDVQYAKVCNNGVAYIVNKVYPPTEFASVMAPVIFSNETLVFNWALPVEGLQFDLYLLSMVNRFSFFVPTDEAMKNYIDPVSVAKDDPERWEFFYNPKTSLVNAVVYKLSTGDSVRTETGTTRIKGALRDIIDNHIVVGDIVPGKSYYPTKGGATIKVAGNSVGSVIEGGGNIHYNERPAITAVYNQTNGTTFFLDKTLQTTHRSVYQALEADSAANKLFFELCRDVELTITGSDGKPKIVGIFQNEKDNAAISPAGNVAFFNNFNYTIYVPGDDQLIQAFNNGIIRPWSRVAGVAATPIDEISDGDERAYEAKKLYDFLCSHFQDNSVYISGEPVDNKTYDTAAKNAAGTKYRAVKVSGNGSNLQITPLANDGKTELPGRRVNVMTSNPTLYRYNVMARDIKFNSGTATGSSGITSSSYVVIHRIDGVINHQ